METHSLIPHPSTPPLAIQAVEFSVIGLDADWLTLRWRITGAAGLVVPPLAGKGRADNLWKTTCFELFVRPGDGPAYSEFNLSPSERWAAYDFTAYREGMANRPIMREPTCGLRGSGALRVFDAAIPRASLPPLPWHCGISAVIVEAHGHLSYWALAHAPGKPDFHAPACFTLPIAAPQPL
ncbi:MAG: DOMON-like domain-containing protein [Sphingomonadales bacterium]|nr:DOMON-like domain-containing protein [Sphingomonadales bacterium]